MPTYQYACTECAHSFEQFQSFSDDALTECPECQGRLRKLFNAVGVVFKGSGFYRTDSRASNGSADGASAGSETKPDTSDKSQSDAKSDAKSASKPDSTSGTSKTKSSTPQGDSGSKTPAAATS